MRLGMMGAIVAENVSGRVVVAGGTFADAGRGSVRQEEIDEGALCVRKPVRARRIDGICTSGFRNGRSTTGAWRARSHTWAPGGTPGWFWQLFSSRPRLHRTAACRDARVGGSRHAWAGHGGQGCLPDAAAFLRSASVVARRWEPSFVAVGRPSARSTPKAVLRAQRLCDGPAAAVHLGLSHLAQLSVLRANMRPGQCCLHVARRSFNSSPVVLKACCTVAPGRPPCPCTHRSSDRQPSNHTSPGDTGRE